MMLRCVELLVVRISRPLLPDHSPHPPPICPPPVTKAAAHVAPEGRRRQAPGRWTLRNGCAEGRVRNWTEDFLKLPFWQKAFLAGLVFSARVSQPLFVCYLNEMDFYESSMKVLKGIRLLEMGVLRKFYESSKTHLAARNGIFTKEVLRKFYRSSKRHLATRNGIFTQVLRKF